MATATLSGVTVLDLSSYIAGPFGATLLGDLGANVIKIEPPGGDVMRSYPSTLEGESRAYIGTNRNKRGIVLDLKKSAALAVFMRLLERADVVLHNFRPGVAERLGVAYEQLAPLPRPIVYCAFTAFGASGPMASHPGFDQVLQSMTGIAAAQGVDEGVPHIVWGSVVDYYGAAMVAVSISAALYNREKTGQSQQIDASLLRSALALQSARMVWAEGEGRNVERDLRVGRVGGIQPTREGYLYVQMNTQPFWRAFCELVKLPELANDPRYDDMRKRKERENELLPLIQAALAKKTAVEWEAILQPRVACTVVNRLEDMFDHPQVHAQGLVATHSHPRLGSYRAMTGPVRWQEGRFDTPDRRAPLVGEHTDEVLLESGYRHAEIEALRACGAIQ